MITFASETIAKKIQAEPLSRISLCCLSLWGFAIVLPVLYLVSIGNISWPQYELLTQTPLIQYQNYEINCGNSGNAWYYTNLKGVTNTGSNQPLVIGSGEQGSTRVTIQLQDADLTSCSGLLYFAVTLQNQISNQFVGVVPFSVYTSSGTLSTCTVSGYVTVSSILALPQNYQSSAKTSAFTQPSQLNMQQTFMALSSQKLSLQSEDVTVQVSTSSLLSVKPTLVVNVSGRGSTILTTRNLLSQMREFFRQWIYVFVPVGWLAGWILLELVKGRIYQSRTSNAIPKHKIL